MQLNIWCLYSTSYCIINALDRLGVTFVDQKFSADSFFAKKQVKAAYHAIWVPPVHHSCANYATRSNILCATASSIIYYFVYTVDDTTINCMIMIVSPKLPGTNSHIVNQENLLMSQISGHPLGKGCPILSVKGKHGCRLSFQPNKRHI